MFQERNSFIKELVLDLIRPYVDRRKMIAEDHKENLRNTFGEPNTKKPKVFYVNAVTYDRNKNRKTKSFFEKCKKNVYKDHALSMCSNCAK